MSTPRPPSGQDSPFSTSDTMSTAEVRHHHTTWRGIPMRIAGDAAGIRALLLGDGPSTFADLRPRLPGSRLVPGNHPAFDAALAHLDNPRDSPPPRLAPIGTPFQQSVWNALRAIPRGQTTTYSGLAANLGNPRAARAVAAACAANPIAILIPCHRVIRRDGSPAGYRWGIDIKLRLLTLERAS